MRTTVLSPLHSVVWPDRTVLGASPRDRSGVETAVAAVGRDQSRREFAPAEATAKVRLGHTYPTVRSLLNLASFLVCRPFVPT
jgi:hypothetical protein